MEIPTIAVAVIALITTGGVFYKIGSRNGNGKHSKSHSEIYKEINKRVERPDCHRSMDGLQDLMKTRFDATDTRLGDIKDLIEKNGG